MQEVEERETEKLENQCACFISCWVFEVDKVDGHRILVEERRNGNKTDV